jgi:hypothetical protein
MNQSELDAHHEAIFKTHYEDALARGADPPTARKWAEDILAWGRRLIARQKSEPPAFEPTWEPTEIKSSVPEWDKDNPPTWSRVDIKENGKMTLHYDAKDRAEAQKICNYIASVHPYGVNAYKIVEIGDGYDVSIKASLYPQLAKMPRRLQEIIKASIESLDVPSMAKRMFLSWMGDD